MEGLYYIVFLFIGFFLGYLIGYFINNNVPLIEDHNQFKSSFSFDSKKLITSFVNYRDLLIDKESFEDIKEVDNIIILLNRNEFPEIVNSYNIAVIDAFIDHRKDTYYQVISKSK